MQAPHVAGAAWREAQLLVGRLAHTRPLPQLKSKQQTHESTLQRQQPGKALSEKQARHTDVVCKAHDRQQPRGRTDVSVDSDVDSDLWEVLELATEDELESIHGILYGSSLMSPLIKSIVKDNEPAAVGRRSRRSLMSRIESRFRFLAADSASTLRGYRPSYREILLRMRDSLAVDCPGTLATQDLEVEIFLYMLQNQLSDNALHMHSGQAPQASTETSSSSSQAQPISRQRSRLKHPSWVQSLTRPLHLAGHDLVPTLLKLGSAVSLDSTRTATLRHLGTRFVAHRARQQAALQMLARCGAGRGAACAVRQRAAAEAARNGMAATAARYGTVRGALGVLGPMMWGWLAVDVALKAIGTDYGRIARAIVALAQIRLLRTYGWTSRQQAAQ